MPPSRKSSSPRSYGRQASGKTIKSLSIDSDLALELEAEAQKRGITFSALFTELAIKNREASLRKDSVKYTVNKKAKE